MKHDDARAQFINHIDTISVAVASNKLIRTGSAEAAHDRLTRDAGQHVNSTISACTNYKMQSVMLERYPATELHTAATNAGALQIREVFSLPSALQSSNRI